MKDHLIRRGSDGRSIFVLYGMGGCGKSETAIKFVEQNRDSFWGIFWVNADKQDTIKQDFANIAKACNISNTRSRMSSRGSPIRDLRGCSYLTIAIARIWIILLCCRLARAAASSLQHAFEHVRHSDLFMTWINSDTRLRIHFSFELAATNTMIRGVTRMPLPTSSSW